MISCYCVANRASSMRPSANGGRDFIDGDHAAREALLSQGGKERSGPKKRRRRSNAKRRTGDAARGRCASGIAQRWRRRIEHASKREDADNE